MGGFKWYPGAEAGLTRKVSKALGETAKDVQRDVIDSQTMPFADKKYEHSGAMQGSLVVVPPDEGGVAQVVATSWMAKRMYLHPEFQFNRDTNSAAGGLWFDPYLERGSKRAFAAEKFAKHMKELL